MIVIMRMVAIKMHVQGNYELHNPKRRNKESESLEKLELGATCKLHANNLNSNGDDDG